MIYRCPYPGCLKTAESESAPSYLHGQASVTMQIERFIAGLMYIPDKITKERNGSEGD